MTKEKEEEKEVQNFQELPHQQHREDDHEEEHTPTSPNASHAGHAEEHEQQEEKKEDNSEDIITVLLSPPPETPSMHPVQDSDEDSHDDTPTPRSFLDRVLTDIDYEIGFLNGLIDFHDKNARYPYCEYFALKDFIKNWLQIDVTHWEMLDVIVKLRKKYIKTKAKMGASMRSSDPRDQRAFNLEHKIWSDAIEEDWKLLKLGVIKPVLFGAAGARKDPGSSH